MAGVTAPGRVGRPGRREPRALVTAFVGYAILIFFSLVFIYPFIIQIATSFKTDANATRQPLSPVPDPLTTAGFERIFSGTDFPIWLGNSMLVTVIITIGRVFLDSLAGYALARLQFGGRRAIFAAVVAVMAVPGVVLLIPKFLVLNQLSIYNTYTALILPIIVDAAGVFIMKQFFESIPVSVEEAARIDGAGVFRTFWAVVLPMARPALITLTILSFQGSWNEFPHTLVAVQDPSLFTLPRGLADLVSGSLGAGTQYPLKLGAALLATIPVAIIFVIFQRYFVRDAAEGAEKG
jgi:multiple sugar transport system permease protein